jgi:hypothetical protein
MSICTDPFAILPIRLNECVGTSLNTINAYWELIKAESCAQETEINELATEIFALSTQIYELSSQFNGLAKAYVVFSGSLSTNAGTLEIFHSYNVSEVSIVSEGVYRVTTTDSIENAGGLGNCSKVTENLYSGWANVGVVNLSTAEIVIANQDGIMSAKPGIVAVAFYGALIINKYE